MSSTPPQNNPSLQRFLLTSMSFLILIGAPMAGGWTFAQTVTKHLWLQIGITMLCGLGGLLVSFIGKVWQKLENPLVDLTSERLKSQAALTFSRCRWRYRQRIVFEHRAFDVKGLSTQTAHALELEHVFVELNVDPTPVHQTSPNPLKMPEPLRHGKHAIWDYLSTPDLSHQHFVIIGAPGSGKTTLLKHMALTLAQHKQSHHTAHMHHKVPILLYLREHASNIKDNPDFSLLDAAREHIQRKWQQADILPWIERYLKQGKCLILLDGLDEVADLDTRKQVVKWLEQQISAYVPNRFILTSRPHGYRDNPLEGVTVLEVRPFMPEQVKRFVQKWYLANELKSWGKEDPGVHMEAQQGAQDLLRRLHRTPALLALAANPLLLTMIATVHRYRSSLPGKRVALYTEICEVFLGKRQEARGIALHLTPAQKQQVLQPLAYNLMQAGVREISLQDARTVIASHLAEVSTCMQPDEFLQDIQNTSGLLLERDPGIYGFAHKTFQEYLAAVYIKEKAQEQILVDKVGDDWWHETIRLYCAQADATRIIEACLASERPSAAALTLAFECNEEKLKAHPSVTQHIDKLLEKGAEDPDPQRRHVIAEALLTRRLRQLIYLHEEMYIDTSLVTCAEYQLFLDEQRAKGNFHQPDHWKTDTFTNGQGCTSILGVRSSDATAFCAWLTERDQEGWLYRLPTSDECKKLAMDRSIAGKLASDTGYWIDDGKGFAWGAGTPPSFDAINGTIQELTHCDLARDLDLARVLARALDLDLDFDLALARALDLDRALDFDLDRALNLDFDLALDLALARDLALTLALARDLALTRDLALALASGRGGDLALNLALARDLALNLARALELGRNFANRSIYPTGRKPSHQDKEAEFFRWLVRYLMLVLARYVRYLSILRSPARKRTWIEQILCKRSKTPQYTTIFEDAIKTYLDLYVSLALLELRIQGKIPAWEGILLVKEHKLKN